MSDEEIKDNVTSKVIHEIKITSDKDKENSEENKRLKAQLQAIALRAFEDKKSEVVNKLTERYGVEKANEISDSIVTPQDLDSYQRMLQVINENERSKVPTNAPTGKVSGSSPINQEQTYDSTGTMIDSLYNEYERMIFLRDHPQSPNYKDYSDDKFQQLQGRVDRLLTNSLKGMQKRGRDVKFQQVSSCMKCNTTMIQGKCPKCGWVDKSYYDQNMGLVS